MLTNMHGIGACQSSRGVVPHRRWLAWLLSSSALAVGTSAQKPLETSAGSIDLEFSVPSIDGVAGTPEKRASWLANLAETTRQRTRKRLTDSLDLASPRIRLAVFADRDEAMLRARSLCHRELFGIAVLAPDLSAAVLHADKDLRDKTSLGGAVAAVTAQMALLQLLPPDDLDRLGYGFVGSALVHEATTAIGNGEVHAFVRGSLRAPFLAFGGNLLTGSSALLLRDRLPHLADLLQTEVHDFDPEQHAAAFALAAWLGNAAAPPTTGSDAPVRKSPLAALVAKAREGESATRALADVLHQDLAAVESRFTAFVRTQKEPNWPKVRTESSKRRPHPHAALFVYVREPVPTRHRAIVQQALTLRGANLTSGFADDDGTPRLRLGPENHNVAFWRGGERGKPIDRAWPFVAVLEYDLEGTPEAMLACYRRIRGRDDDDGWMLDPMIAFVEHHNAQIAEGRDDRFAYLAIPDTPTGTRIAESEFVHRARVRWQDGSEAVIGTRTMLDAFRSEKTDGWSAEVEPLVDWLVVARNDALGVTASSALKDLRRELSPFGSKRVFSLPEVPVGLRVGR